MAAQAERQLSTYLQEEGDRKERQIPLLIFHFIPQVGNDKVTLS